jgi:hypothetical protein
MFIAIWLYPSFSMSVRTEPIADESLSPYMFSKMQQSVIISCCERPSVSLRG